MYWLYVSEFQYFVLNNASYDLILCLIEIFIVKLVFNC